MPVVRSPSAFQLRRGHLAWAHWRHLLCNWNSDHRSSSTYTKSVFQLASLLTFTSNSSHSPLTDREANKSANANVHFSSISLPFCRVLLLCTQLWLQQGHICQPCSTAKAIARWFYWYANPSLEFYLIETWLTDQSGIFVIKRVQESV